MLEEKETRLQTMDITFSSRFTDQQMHKKVREDTAQDLQEREMKVCKEGFIINCGSSDRSFTNLSMHCSGNLDLFLSCSTDLWTDGSSRMNASFHFFPKTWLENPKKWIKHRCLFGFFAKPAVVLEGEHNIEPDQESQTCKPDQRRNVHCSRWSFSRFSVSHAFVVIHQDRSTGHSTENRASVNLCG